MSKKGKYLKSFLALMGVEEIEIGEEEKKKEETGIDGKGEFIFFYWYPPVTRQ